MSKNNCQTISAKHIAMLWMTLSSVYKNLFISQFGLTDDGTWFAALNDLTPKAIETGINSLMRLEAGSEFCKYPPKPLEFRAMCLSFYKDLGLPTAADAFKEIELNIRLTRPYYSHDAVKYVDHMLGADFFNNINRRAMYATFKEIYNKVCHIVKQGHELPEIPEYLRYLSKQTTNKGTTVLKKLKTRLGERQ